MRITKNTQSIQMLRTIEGSLRIIEGNLKIIEVNIKSQTKGHG